MPDGELTFIRETLGRTKVAWYPQAAPVIVDVERALDAIGALYGSDAQLIAIPVSQLPAAFFTLSTRLAGEILQKFQNYGLRVAIVGDIAEHLTVSRALTDFVGETTRRGEVLFVADRNALEARLG